MVASAGAGAAVSTRRRRSCCPHDAYTVRVARRPPVLATVTGHPAAARRWVHTTWWRHARCLRSGARLAVGLGVQWTVPSDGGGEGGEPAATLQLCAGHRCLVLHLARAERVPAALRRFLADPRVSFFGYNILSDCRRLLRGRHALAVAPGGCHELRALTGMGNASMELMAQLLLGYPRIKKSRRVAMSNWDSRRLSEEQAEYACVDAVLACRLGERLRVGAGH